MDHRIRFNGIQDSCTPGHAACVPVFELSRSDEHKRKFFIGHFVCMSVFCRNEAGFFICCGETFSKYYCFSGISFFVAGISAKCPTEARTTKSSPRIFEIVFTLFGDSTITKGRVADVSFDLRFDVAMAAVSKPWLCQSQFTTTI